MPKLPTRTKRSIAIFLAVAWWLVWAGMQGIGGYIKNGGDGVHDQLIEFLLMHLVLIPIFIALYIAGKFEKRLKCVFPIGASFIAITLALVISIPIGFYLLINVSKYLHA